MTHLKAHDPLIVDTSDLGRRPGEMRTLTRVVKSPERFGNDVMNTSEGADIDLDLRLESVMEGVLISGNAVLHMSGECVRCLDAISLDLDIDVQELFNYPDKVPAELDKDEVVTLEDDLADLLPIVRDVAALQTPYQPLCSEDCAGLCSECGIRLEDEPDHEHEILDARWAALAALASPDHKETPQE